MGKHRWARRLRMPKSIRHLKPGRMLMHAGLGMIPGVSTARDLGLFAGDPKPKRKAAGSGPKAKHQAKQHKKATHAAHAGHAAKHGRGKKWGKAAGAALGQIGGALGEAYRNYHGDAPGTKYFPGAGGDDDAPPVPIAGADGSVHMLHPAHARALGLGGRRHRKVNPANVKALRRGIRRLEGFQKLVKSVEKAYPRLRSSHASHGHAKGHKAGCKCVACRHR